MISATIGALCFAAGVVVGSGVAALLEDRKGKKRATDSDYRWRTDMSYLLGHLIRLGYETEITPENLFLVDAPGDRYLFSMSVHRFDPATLLAELSELPPAGRWGAHRRGESRSSGKVIPMGPFTKSSIEEKQ